MRKGLIGATGFVGGNLSRQTTFDDGFHSKDIHTIVGRHYDLLVCAGMPAEKWRANQDPESDRASLDKLIDGLEGVRADRVVLISTVDVYPDPSGVDESTPIDPDRNHPYGRHRYLLERFVSDRFPTTVVRLPGLFGPGLKKNVVYDLLHGRPTDGVPGSSTHQYYDLHRLWTDVRTALSLGLHVVNFATEPVSVEAISQRAFGVPYPDAREDARVVHYDMKTIHAESFGGSDDYLESSEQVLERLREFVTAEGWVRP